MPIIKNNYLHFNIEEVIWHRDPVSREKLFQVVLFSQGSGEVQLDFQTYSFTSPALFFISEYQLFTTLKGEGVKGKVVQFSNDFFCVKLNRSETFCDGVLFNIAMVKPLVLLNSTEFNNIEFLFDSLEKELLEPNTYQEEIIVAQLKGMLLQASKIKLKQIGNLHFHTLSQAVLQFQSLLDKHYRLEHGVQYYADALFMTPKALNKSVKKELGRTAGELIVEKLLVEAKRALYQNIYSVKEISIQLGFADPAYFSRFFKRETKHSPLEFVEMISKS